MADKTFDDDPFDTSEPTSPVEEKRSPPKDPETGRFVSPKSQHSPYWLRLAEETGLSTDDVSGLDPDELKEEVRYRRNQIASHQQSLRREDVRGSTAGSPPAPSEEDDFKVPDVLDPEIAALLRAQHNEIKSLKGQFGGLAQREQSRAARDRDRVFDSAFTALGPAFEQYVGKGSAEDLQGTDDFARRFAIVEAARITDQDGPAEIRKKIAAVAKVLFKPSAKSAYETPPTEREREWVENTVERPTHRQVPELPKGYSKAVQTYERLAKANGHLSEQPEENYFE